MKALFGVAFNDGGFTFEGNFVDLQVDEPGKCAEQANDLDADEICVIAGDPVVPPVNSSGLISLTLMDLFSSGIYSTGS